VINDEILTYDLGAEEELTPEQWQKQKLWVWPSEPPTLRCTLYLALWEKLRPLTYDQIITVIGYLRAWVNIAADTESKDCPMSLEQLGNLKNHPFIDVGVHTVSHPALSCHSLKTQQKEIAGCRQYLEDHFQKPADTIAYPYGNYNTDTLRVVKDQQMKAGFTTEERSVTSRSEPFSIGRFQVRNWNGEEFNRRLARWLKEY
jgi:peptidoglycan/xylan/chitin deacetylase (PgdA/CDA1 family)